MADLYDRYTKTPITFRDVKNAQGKTWEHPPTLVDTLTSLFSGDSGKNFIEVSPQVGHEVLKHEIAHAILNRLPPGGLEKAQSDISVLPAIRSAFLQAGFKDPNTEIPAYAASGELQNIKGENKNWQDLYIDAIKQRLFQMNPQIAQWYGSVSQPSVISAQPQGVQ